MAERTGTEIRLEITENPDEYIDYFERFSFIKSRPIESLSNFLSNKEDTIKREILDAAFDEGVFMAYD